jgi:hypothetical protein
MDPGLRRRFYDVAQFVGSDDHGGTPPFPGAALAPTSWTLIIHGGSPPCSGAALGMPSPTLCAPIVMAVLLLCAFVSPSSTSWALIVVVVVVIV